MLNAFTIDVEDYYHVSAFERQIDRKNWDQYESRVTQNTYRLLEILGRRQIQATFFVLGWVAERNHQLVRDIHAAGHEIGSHTYWHRLIYEQSPDDFRADVRRSRGVLEDILGVPVKAFRAPSFSITNKSLWALDILVEEGFTIDSSIFPIRRSRYGIPTAPKGAYRLQTKAGSLYEFPPSVTRILKKSVPVCGGGYFRLYPSFLTQFGLARFHQQHRMPFVFYLHPWEIDPDQPRIREGTALNRFRHYVNLNRTEAKLEALLARFRFGTLSQSIASIESKSPATIVQSRVLQAA